MALHLTSSADMLLPVQNGRQCRFLQGCYHTHSQWPNRPGMAFTMECKATGLRHRIAAIGDLACHI
jgi:hypothetical protein